VEARLVQGFADIAIGRAVVGPAGAGNQENQRRRALLQGVGITQFLVVEKHVRNFPVREDFDAASLQRNPNVEISLIVRGSPDNSRDERIIEGIVVGAGRGA
jgi:hypothetical protein